jgi:tungstate transport system substrate-binding protein
MLALPACNSREALRMATTTSLYDTGLWGYLEPVFEEKYGVELDVLYAGTGKALEWGTRGDVDVLTVHDRIAEEKFIADGYGVKRVVFAYNYFLVVGPESDPAGIKGMHPVEAFRRLMTDGPANPSRVKFVSRGDGSGTHAREKSLWAAAGNTYDDVKASGSWYVEGGGGMGSTLVMANEKQAYTLSDIGTYLAFKGDLKLVPILDRGEELLNVYSVIVVKNTRNRAMADNLVAFLTSSEIQALIGEYGVKEFGGQLFTPCAGQDL